MLVRKLYKCSTAVKITLFKLFYLNLCDSALCGTITLAEF